MPYLPNPQEPGEWTWLAPDEKGEQGFKLREVQQEHPDVFDMSQFAGREDIPVVIKVTRESETDEGFTTHEKVVFFDYGESEEEAWDNYYEAVRDAVRETRDDYEDEFPDADIEDSSEDASVAVVAVG